MCNASMARSADNDVLRKARYRGIVAFDNQSAFPKGFADTLAALVTGTGDSKRELYTTDTEYAFQVRRPVIVNGINMPSDRADLLSRFVALEVPPIEAEDCVPESKFWEEFGKDRGILLGAYFDIRSGVLRLFVSLPPMRCRLIEQECTGEGLPYLVRLQGVEKPPFWRVTSSEIRRGLVGTAKRGRRAAPEEGGDLLPRVYLRSGLRAPGAGPPRVRR
jgi:hypothetical protein